MEYLDISTAQQREGLKLVLTRGVPGPWGEAAKAILRHHQIAYLPVAQHGGQSNEALVAWTGHRNAPLLLVPGEPARANWLEILNFAERAGSGPSLLPACARERASAIGLAHAICGEEGLAWNVRLLILDAIKAADTGTAAANPMLDAYGYLDGFAQQRAAVFSTIDAHLALFNEQLAAQRTAGSPYLLGDGYTIVDLYWAYFSQLLRPMPAPDNPVTGPARSLYELYQRLAPDAPVDALLEHARWIFNTHLLLPMDF